MNLTTKQITDAVCTMLKRHTLTPFVEYVLPNGRRLDVACIGNHGRLLGVEVKRDTRDFNRDLKFSDSMAQCFIFYIAVPVGFNTGLIHPGIRVIQTDGNNAWIMRRTGVGLLPENEWHKAGFRYAVNPAPGVDPARNHARGDSARARLWSPLSGR